MDVELFCAAQRALVGAEAAAETAEAAALLDLAAPQLARTGLGLINLQVSSTRTTALGGDTQVELTTSSRAGGGAGVSLPTHRLRVGDNVAIIAPASANSGASISGVVTRVRDASIIVAVKQELDGDELVGDNLRVIKLGNEITYRRMTEAMDNLSKKYPPGSSLPDLVAVLMGHKPPTYHIPAIDTITFFNQQLNTSQREAVAFALGADQLACIHGPPGTGKTETVVEIIRQLVQRGERVLVCGPSNTSVDTVVSRLRHASIDFARLGHPARVRKEILDHALEVRVRSSDEGKIVGDVRAEMDKTLATATRTRKKAERRQAFADLKVLRKELRQRETKVVSDIMRNCKVILSTLSGAASQKLVRGGDTGFDTVVIDESSQAIEAECWIALSRGAKRAIFAGDHRQLPPTVKSSSNIDGATTRKRNPGGAIKPESLTLDYTLFDRLLDIHGDKIKRMLSVQHRMHTSIMEFPSRQLYDGKLIAHESVASHLLSDLPNVDATDETTSPLMMLDTSQAGFLESSESEDNGQSILSDSTLNRAEADVVVSHVRKLLTAGVQPRDIAIITPYSAQVRVIRSLLSDLTTDDDEGGTIDVGSVDSLQGSEREAVVLSLVRSNPERKVGFLADIRRLNVAVTRARRHLAIVGDSSTLRTKFLTALFDFVEENGDRIYV